MRTPSRCALDWPLYNPEIEALANKKLITFRVRTKYKIVKTKSRWSRWSRLSRKD